MDRKDFIKKGLLGTGVFLTSSAFGNIIKNDIDELKELDIIGYNHIPKPQSHIMDNSVFHQADTRGGVDLGWLKSRHTFSFSNYYNPDRMHFGVLRVLNDDNVAPGMGFGTHPHDNMEIISIPLEGDLEHRDSMSNIAVIKNGDIQVMSAGSGITHSEYNKSKDQAVKFLQIWVFPNQRNVTPRYDQLTLKLEDRHNKLQQVLSPNADDEGVWIHQNAWFHLGKFDKDVTTTYKIKSPGNGLYIFNLSGTLLAGTQELNTRDGFGVWDINEINLTAKTNSEFLIMEVPMAI